MFPLSSFTKLDIQYLLHDPDHGQESSVQLANQRLLLRRPSSERRCGDAFVSCSLVLEVVIVGFEFHVEAQVVKRQGEKGCRAGNLGAQDRATDAGPVD